MKNSSCGRSSTRSRNSSKSSSCLGKSRSGVDTNGAGGSSGGGVWKNSDGLATVAVAVLAHVAAAASGAVGARAGVKYVVGVRVAVGSEVGAGRSSSMQ